MVGMSGDLSPMRWAARQASTAEELDTEESGAKDSELDADSKLFNSKKCKQRVVAFNWRFGERPSSFAHKCLQAEQVAHLLLNFKGNLLTFCLQYCSRLAQAWAHIS